MNTGKRQKLGIQFRNTIHTLATEISTLNFTPVLLEYYNLIPPQNKGGLKLIDVNQDMLTT